MKYYSLIIWLFIIVTNTNLLAQEEYFFDKQPLLKEWVKERVKNAQDKKREIVELPLAVRTKAWGSKCPDHYIGISTSTREGPWLMPLTPKDFPISDNTGYSLIVTGYFTGKQITKDYRRSEKEPQNWIYTLPEFKILSWRKNKLDYEIDSPKILK